MDRSILPIPDQPYAGPHLVDPQLRRSVALARQ